MTPVNYFTIWLELVLNTLIDATCFSAAYTHVFRKSNLTKISVYFVLFPSFCTK